MFDLKKSETSRKGKDIVSQMPPCCISEKRYKDSDLIQIFVSSGETEGFLQTVDSSVFLVALPKDASPPLSDPTFLYRVRTKIDKTKSKSRQRTEITCQNVQNGAFLSRVGVGTLVRASTSHTPNISYFCVRQDRRWMMSKMNGRDLTPLFSAQKQREKSNLFLGKSTSPLYFSAISTGLCEFENITFLSFEKAILQKEEKKIRELVEQSEIEATSLLCWAARLTDDPILFEFIRNLPEINQRTKLSSVDISHNSPLHIASAHGNLHIVESLLKKGMSVSEKNDLGFTPFHCLCQCDPKDPSLLQNIGKTMLKTDPTIASLRTSTSYFPLHFCCMNSAVTDQLLPLLIQNLHVELDDEDAHFFRPIDYLIFGGKKEKVKMMIEAGAQLSSSSKKELSKSDLLTPLLPFLVEKISQQTMKNKETELDLGSCRLAQLPKVAAKAYSGVRVVDLHRNGLSELPHGQRRTRNLIKVNLSRNHFSVWPIFDYATTIKELNLSHNSIEEIPNAIGHLVSLQLLNLSSNQIKKLPKWFWLGMGALEELYLQNNKLAEFEPLLISGAKSLVILDLSRNQISAISNSVSHCKTLRYLDLKGNPLSYSKDLVQSSTRLLEHLRGHNISPRNGPDTFLTNQRNSPSALNRHQSLPHAETIFLSKTPRQQLASNMKQPTNQQHPLSSSFERRNSLLALKKRTSDHRVSPVIARQLSKNQSISRSLSRFPKLVPITTPRSQNSRYSPNRPSPERTSGEPPALSRTPTSRLRLQSSTFEDNEPPIMLKREERGQEIRTLKIKKEKKEKVEVKEKEAEKEEEAEEKSGINRERSKGLSLGIPGFSVPLKEIVILSSGWKKCGFSANQATLRYLFNPKLPDEIIFPEEVPAPDPTPALFPSLSMRDSVFVDPFIDTPKVTLARSTQLERGCRDYFASSGDIQSVPTHCAMSDALIDFQNDVFGSPDQGDYYINPFANAGKDDVSFLVNEGPNDGDEEMFIRLLDLGINSKFSQFFAHESHFSFCGHDESGSPYFLSVMCQPFEEYGGYLMLIRTVDLDTFTILETFQTDKKKKVLVPRLVLKALKRTLPLSLVENLKLVNNPEAPNLHLEIESKLSLRTYKIGILHCPDASMDEDEMYSSMGSDNFFDFLSLLGEVVLLKGWGNYAGGLDVKTNSTGNRSLYTRFLDFEIMFHVSPLLPFHEDDPQRLERKRHLGNDIVVIVFVEKGKLRPDCFRSKYQQVLVVVQKIDMKPAQYHISVVVKDEVGKCFPTNLQDQIIVGDIKLRYSLLALIINLERTVLQSVDLFIKLFRRARLLMLNELINSCMEEGEEEKEEGKIPLPSDRPQRAHKRNLSTNLKSQEMLKVVPKATLHAEEPAIFRDRRRSYAHDVKADSLETTKSKINFFKRNSKKKTSKWI